MKIILCSRVDFGSVASGNNECVTVILLVDLIHKSFDMVIKKRKSSPCFCIGFFVAEDAGVQVKAYRKVQFMEDELPILFRNIYLLNIEFDELERRYKSFVNETFKS